MFDPARIADAASFERPTERAAGIHSVYVNGAPVWREHAFTGRHPPRAGPGPRGVDEGRRPLYGRRAPETGPRDATIRLHAAGLRARPPQEPDTPNRPWQLPNPLPAIVGKEEMGARLRAERKAQKMTLQALSRASGIAVSTLSKAELGQIALSYEKFAALARALRIDMTRLFMPGDASPAQVAPTYVKNSLIEARDYITPNYHHRLLMGEYPGKKMIPIWATITSREVVEFDDYIRHPGQEFVLVLAGKVRIQFENGDSVVLGKLESAYFDSGIGHVYLTLSKQPAEVLAVCSDVEEIPTRKRPL